MRRRGASFPACWLSTVSESPYGCSSSSPAIFITLLAVPSRELGSVHRGELYALILAATVSLMWMANSVNLLMIYLSLEMVSIISYIMVGYLRRERLSNEASLKYVVFGAVSTGTMLYGMSFLFGLTGSLDLFEIRAALQNGAAGEAGPALLLIVILILAGIGFKTAAVPFHFWCPDVYTRSSHPGDRFPIRGAESGGIRRARSFLLHGNGGATTRGAGQAWEMVGSVDWQAVLIGLSIATMTLGNVAALLQTNLKRLLAYSSIAHAGYILMGAAVLSGEGIQAMLAYMVIYFFMNLGAFLVVMAIYDDTGASTSKTTAGCGNVLPILP